MQNKTTIIGTIIAVVVLMFLISGAYIVNEAEQVIITRFGKPIGNAITEPGIHFKTPFIEDAHFFEKRFLEWDGDANQIPTKGKKFIWVDTYARWRISDPLLFFQRVRDERGAQARLDDILDGETRNAIANHFLREIIRNSNRKPVITELDSLQDEDMSDVFPPIKVGRERIMQEILEKASPRTKELGIELLDIRFKRINYYEDVRKKVYERMITERKRIADKFRSEGQGRASEILGNKERELKRIQSEAYRTAREIIGKADAQATAIYARAYNRNADTRDFYRFLKTLETYKTTFSDKDWLILSTKSDFFKFLRSESGR
ncbi:MAG TPA: protease modulator HflC [Caldithrix abyssi]|uniref:Protein HflC n=1 Tax=Caldithrix abyssi TaxID=187145 RepID=A0A7V5UFQ1_CALAY|nr:protease modulator HflC [Caldithrix abyssi]